jgi:leader peptidase (prepilin peptidase)/N-methyltransferase
MSSMDASTAVNLIGPLAAAGLGGAAAAALVPALTRRWIPASDDTTRRAWTGRTVSGICGAAAAAALTYRHSTTRSGELLILAAWLIFLIVGLSLAWIDIRLHRLPTPLIHTTGIIVLTLLAGAAVVTGRPTLIVTPLLAAAAIGGGYLTLVATGLSTIGMGDVRMAALTGLLLGTAGWTTVALGAALPYLLATPYAIIVQHRHDGTTHLPFGPFLLAATITMGVLRVTT